jgi:hypothetical protein
MSSPTTLTWSATEPMALSLAAEMEDLSSSLTTRIPSSAQRYYNQPRVSGFSGSPKSPRHQPRGNLTKSDPLARRQQRLGQEDDQKENDKGAQSAKPKWQSTGSKLLKLPSAPPKWSIIHVPIRQSPRLVKKRAAALESMLRQRVSGNFTRAVIKRRKNAKRRSIDSISDDLPALSEDPASYNSNTKDCRLHLPTTTEDRLAIRAALTPTLFRLQKTGWQDGVVWNQDASYMEAHQKCLREYYKFTKTKKPDSSPSDLPAILTLLPWYGRIGDFRSSPNWPDGW